MWNLANTDLGEGRTSDETVVGLELTELGSNEIRSPLFRFQPLASYSISTRGVGGAVNPGTGQEPVVDNETVLEPESILYLYNIKNIWDITGYDKVLSLNFLRSNKYTHFNGFTYILAPISEESISLTTSFFTYLPNPDSSFTYSLNVVGFNIDSIEKVLVNGLEFKSSGNQTFTYDANSGLLLLNASANCKPEVGSLVEIISNRTVDLTQTTKQKVYVFDYSSLNISLVSYLEYKGKAYTQSNSLASGTLFNNYFEKKAYVLE